MGVFRAPLFELRVSCRMRIDLSSPAPRAGYSVREVARSELDQLGREWPLPELSCAVVDRIAGAPWRCFIASDDSAVVHHSFVAMQEPTPLLFQCVTAPSRRRRGAFASTVAGIAASLRDEGHAHLESSTAGSNRASLVAHQRAGFRVVRRTYYPIVLGVDVRRVLSGVKRRLIRRHG